MKKQYLLASFIISALLFPVLASAATADEIRAQIQSLLNQITALQAQLNNLTPKTSMTTTASFNSCPNLYRTLSRGSRGDDVISLQQFLITQGLLSSDSATGFFGSMTEAAVQQWQLQNAVDSIGIVGARTRATVAARCGITTPPVVQSCPQYQIPICSAGQHVESGTTDLSGCVGAPRCVNNTVLCPIYSACPSGYTANTSTNSNGCIVQQCIPPVTNGSLSASPVTGLAPLTVNFHASGGTLLDFGDNVHSADCGTAQSLCQNISNTYSTPGTYTAKLTNGNQTIGTAMITVADNAVPTITSILPSSGLVGTQVTLKGANFKLTQDNNILFSNKAITTATSNDGTTLTFTIPSVFPAPICLSCGSNSGTPVSPGAYAVSVTVGNGAIASDGLSGAKQSNAVTFTVTTATNATPVLPPVLSSDSCAASASLGGAMTSSITDPNNFLVGLSKQAMTNLGISDQYFQNHFQFICAQNVQGDNLVRWKYAIGEFTTTLDDRFGFYTDSSGVHYKSNFSQDFGIPLVSGSIGEVSSVITKQAAADAMQACIGDFTGAQMYLGNPADGGFARPLLGATPAVNGTYCLPQGGPGMSSPCLIKTGWIDLTTGKCTKNF